MISRVAELAEKHGISITGGSLAWSLTKVTSPIVVATKPHHMEGAVKGGKLLNGRPDAGEFKKMGGQFWKPKYLKGKGDNNGKTDSGKRSAWRICAEVCAIK